MADSKINFSELKELNFAQYKKQYLKKATFTKCKGAIIFVDYKLANKKTSCVIIPIKKLNEAAKLYKEVKGKKEHLIKKTGLADLQFVKNKEGKTKLKIELKKGGLKAEILKSKATKLFDSIKLEYKIADKSDSTDKNKNVASNNTEQKEYIDQLKTQAQALMLKFSSLSKEDLEKKLKILNKKIIKAAKFVEDAKVDIKEGFQESYNILKKLNALNEKNNTNNKENNKSKGSFNFEQQRNKFKKETVYDKDGEVTENRAIDKQNKQKEELEKNRITKDSNHTRGVGMKSNFNISADEIVTKMNAYGEMKWETEYNLKYAAGIDIIIDFGIGLEIVLGNESEINFENKDEMLSTKITFKKSATGSIGFGVKLVELVKIKAICSVNASLDFTSQITTTRDLQKFKWNTLEMEGKIDAALNIVVEPGGTISEQLKKYGAKGLIEKLHYEHKIGEKELLLLKIKPDSVNKEGILLPDDVLIKPGKALDEFCDIYRECTRKIEEITNYVVDGLVDAARFVGNSINEVYEEAKEMKKKYYDERVELITARVPREAKNFLKIKIKEQVDSLMGKNVSLKDILDKVQKDVEKMSSEAEKEKKKNKKLAQEYYEKLWDKYSDII